MPGIFSEEGNWRRWVLIPLLDGLLCGIFVVILDLVFAQPLRFAAATAALALALGAGIFSIVRYRQSEESLERYMTEYVQSRDLGLPAPARKRPIVPRQREQVIRVQFTENPFAEDDIIGPFENPFQSEGQ